MADNIDPTTVTGLVGDPNAVPDMQDTEVDNNPNAAPYGGDNMVGGTNPVNVPGIPTDSTTPTQQDTIVPYTEATYPSSVADYSPTTGGIDPATVTPGDALAGGGTLSGNVPTLTDSTGTLGQSPKLSSGMKAETSVVDAIGQVNPTSQGTTDKYLEMVDFQEKFISSENLNYLYPNGHRMTNQMRWFKGSRDRGLRSDVAA